MSGLGEIIVVAVSLAAAAGAAIGVLLRRPVQRVAWLLLGAALLVFAAADLLALVADPGAADLAHLAGYPLLCAGLYAMREPGSRGRDGGALVDAAIIATTAAIGWWLFLAGPALDEGTGRSHALALGYLVFDVAVLGLGARLVVGVPTRAVTTLLALAVATLIGTDVGYLLGPVGARNDLTDPLQLGWLTAACLVAAAALHPAVSGPEVRRGVAPSDGSATGAGVPRVRLALLGAVALIPPALIGLQASRGDYGDSRELAGLSLGLFVLTALVVARVGLLMRELARIAERERALRASAAHLVAAGDRADIETAMLTTVRQLAGTEVLAARLLDATPGHARPAGATAPVPTARPPGVPESRLAADLLRAVGPAGADGRGVPARTLGADLRGRLGSAVDAAAGAEAQVHALPVHVEGDLRVLLVLVTTGGLGPGALDALASLGAQLVLALESVALSSALAARRGEARFRALVQHSVDAILLVDDVGAVGYQSPSVERVLGWPDDQLAGRALQDLCHPHDLVRLESGLDDVRAGAGGLSRTLELRLCHPDGDWVDVEAVVTDLREETEVEAVLVTVRDVSQRKEFERSLTHRAFHDDLTGLANRALFLDRVGHALGRGSRSSSTLAVLLLDLDDFKTVNDGLGHAAGDALLRLVGERLELVVRPGDTTARLSGDEFAMLLVDLPDETAAVHAVERVTAALADPFLVGAKEVFVQASVGLAFAGATVATSAEVLRSADAAMHVVKANGRGGYAVYEPQMHVAALDRLDLRADLVRALELGEFRVHYQPIVSVATGKVSGLEALVRWEHPHRGLVPPDAFIPLAEETGLIAPLGLWVLGAACAQSVEWSAANPALTMSVNVSLRQLRRPEFPAEVARVLADTGIEPSRVALEITESAVLADPAAMVARLHALRALGVRLAVDDFGTGYSSFSWLRQLPIDVLKIDKEFVDELGRRDQGGYLVGTIIELAHNLGLRTVAEGIEHPGQLARLKELSCDLGQGFHLGRPTTSAGVVDLLALERDRRSGRVGA